MASNEWLVRKLHEQDKKIEALSRGGTGVGHTSIAPGENLTVISDNGEVVLGAGGVEHVDGPTPATPTAPTLKLGFGTIETTWDGSFAEGEDEDGVPLTAPVDFDVVEVHCSTDPEEEEWGEDTMRGQIKTREGGTITVGGFDVDDEVFVCLIALAKTGKRSAPSATASLVIEGLDFSQLFTEIDAANATIKNAGEVLVSEQGTLDEKLTEVDGTLNDLGQDLQAVEDAQAQLDTDLTDVMTSVDGKNTITWNPSAPSAVSNPGKAVGDLWYRTSGNSIIGFWKWDGTDWITQLLDKTTIPLIDIGAGTFGNLAGARLTAGSIGAEKLYIGVPGNLVVDPTFEQGTSGRTIGAHAIVTEGGVRKFRADAANSQFSAWGLNGVSIPAIEGQVYRFECEFDATGGGGVRVFGSVRNGLGTVISAIGSPTVTGSGKFVWETVMPAAGASVSCSFRASQAGVKIWLPAAYQIAGATTIQDGVVSTQKLSADVLEVKNLKATQGQLDEAVINKLWADVVVSKMAVAEQFIGENAILTGAVTAPKITASEELWAKIAEFVKIRAEHIAADAIDGMVITGPTIQSGRSGRRWVGDPNGIRIINEDEDVRTQLSPDGSVFKGEVEADTLVVNEGAEFKANNTLAQGAKLTLAAGVTDPTAPPTVQPYWGGLEANESLANARGLAWDGANYWTVNANAWGVSDRFIRINGSTGEVTRFDHAPALPNFSELFGVTCIGSELFWLYRSKYDHRVLVTDLNGVQKREFPYPYEDAGHSATNPLVYKPGIGNDGTNVVIAHCTDAGDLIFRTYNKTTGTKTSGVSTGENVASDIVGAYVGAGDFGSNHMVAARASNNSFIRYTMSGNRVDSGGWFSPDREDSTGIVYVDGKFRSLDPAGTITEYGDTSTGDESQYWWACYAWAEDFDDNGITETWSRPSPPKRFTWPRRAKLKILGQPLPDGVQMILPALAKKETVPVRTDFHSPTWEYVEGKSEAHYSTLPTDWETNPSPRDSNNFPEAEPSTIETTNKQFRVNGDGSGKWGPLTFFANGSWSGAVVSGQVVITSPSANSTTSVEVTFPPGRFVNIPELTLTAYTNSPRDVSVGVRDVSATSFTINMFSTASGPRRIAWIAFDQGA